jgi:hypothetical protein
MIIAVIAIPSSLIARFREYGRFFTLNSVTMLALLANLVSSSMMLSCAGRAFDSSKKEDATVQAARGRGYWPPSWPRHSTARHLRSIFIHVEHGDGSYTSLSPRLRCMVVCWFLHTHAHDVLAHASCVFGRAWTRCGEVETGSIAGLMRAMATLRFSINHRFAVALRRGRYPQLCRRTGSSADHLLPTNVDDGAFSPRDRPEGMSLSAMDV